jgi:hypothetical protein
MSLAARFQESVSFDFRLSTAEFVTWLRLRQVMEWK